MIENINALILMEDDFVERVQAIFNDGVKVNLLEFDSYKEGIKEAYTKADFVIFWMPMGNSFTVIKNKNHPKIEVMEGGYGVFAEMSK